MVSNNDFLAAFAKVSVFTLFIGAAVLIPLGIWLISLPCMALDLTGWWMLGTGGISLWYFLRIVFQWLIR